MIRQIHGYIDTTAETLEHTGLPSKWGTTEETWKHTLLPHVCDDLDGLAAVPGNVTTDVVAFFIHLTG